MRPARDTTLVINSRVAGRRVVPGVGRLLSFPAESVSEQTRSIEDEFRTTSSNLRSDFDSFHPVVVADLLAHARLANEHAGAARNGLGKIARSLSLYPRA